MKVKTTTVRRKDEDDANLFISGPAEMADAGVAGSDGEWEEDDERAHNNLMSEISKITKKKKMGLAPRSVRISTREGGAEVNTQDILKRIGIKSVKKLQPLPTPLEKVAIRRTKRAVGYDKVACEASKWGSLVHKRRAKDQLTFPLQQPDVQVYTTLKTEDTRMKTPLEQEIYTLLQGAKLGEDRKETNEEKERKRAMSLEELKERNRLAWKEKEEKKRIERKAWMQNKNKSRKFHRLLRRDRLKKQKSDLTDLEKKNPEEFLEKLEELERSRVEERMTLRHRHSKWAHLQGLRATRDETAMAALKENQNMHQELVAKRKLDESESEEEEQIEEKLEALKKERQAALETGLFDPSNPWTANLMRQLPERVEMTPESAIDDSFVNFKKFWDEVNRRKLIEKKARDAIAARERAEKESSEEEKGDDDGSEKDDGVKENGDVALVEMKESDGDDKAENSGETKDAGNLTNGGDISKKKKMKKKKGQKMKGKENVKDKESENKLKLKDDNDENVSKVEKQGSNEKDNEKKKKKNTTKKKQEKLKRQTSDTKETEIEKNADVENMDAKDDGSQENVEKSDKKVLKKNAAKKGKLKTQEKKKKINSDADDKQIQSKKKKAGKNKQKKEAGDVDGEDGNDDLEEQLVCIDNMFAQAELGLQKKLKKKLEKLGIDASGDKEWTKVTSKKKKNKKEDRGILPKIEEFDFTITRDEDNLDEGLDRAKTLEDMDVLQNKSGSEDHLQKAAKTLRAGKEGKEASSGSDKKPPAKIAEVDPSKFLQVDTKLLQAAMPDTISRGVEGLDDDEDDEDDAEDILREAFAEDYLVGEFKSEKNEAIEKDKPQSLSLVLPGWGEWTGPNIKVSRRKRRQFTFHAPPAQPRKDSSLGNVLYNEKADVHDNLRKALVSELPYPFSRVQDFEASVRAPIGRLFVPEKEHQKLIAPPVITKMGCIIEPMNEEELLSYKYLSDAKERKNKQSDAKERRNKQGKKNSNNKRRRNNDGNTSQKLLKINQ